MNKPHDMAVYLASAVFCVALMKRLGCAAVLGYLFAGIAIGPFGLRLIHDLAAAHQRAHFGVVLRLFRIGLELQPNRLWALRRAIFGMGSAQLVQPAVDGPGVGRRAEPAGGGAGRWRGWSVAGWRCPPPLSCCNSWWRATS
ncbi:MAG: hypothetical protein EXR83_10775 [Gammaproteobacteria bacterium]|nr:hypothetical protein [Gammaproteobacteria bacterium]